MPLDTDFPIRLDRSMRPVLLLFGVWRRSRARVRLTDGRLIASFGFGRADIALADVEWWSIEGPWHWIRAVGIRHTLFSSDMSFAGTAAGGLRLHLRRRYRIAWIRATDFYVTVEDPVALGAALSARGITGEDRRRR